MGEIQALSEILMGDLPSRSVSSLEKVFTCNSSLKHTGEEGNHDTVGLWVWFVFQVTENLFCCICYTHSFSLSFLFFKLLSFFLNWSYLYYIKKTPNQQNKTWFPVVFCLAPSQPPVTFCSYRASSHHPGQVLGPARSWVHAAPLRSTLLASVLQNHPQTTTTCREVGWTFRDQTFALDV